MSELSSGKECIDLRCLRMMLWRRRWVALAVFFIGVSIVTIFMTFVQPAYMGRTLLLVEVSQSDQRDGSALLSEVEVLKSRIMARRVVEHLNLMSDPEFNARFEYQGTAGGRGFKKLSVYGSALETLPEDVTDKDVDAVVSRFLNGLGVRSVRGSDVIQIDFTSGSANKAALITNTFADLYLEQRFDKAFQSTQKVTGLLDERLSALREQVQAADRAVADYKQTHNISEEAAQPSVSSAVDLSEVNSQLSKARVEHADAKARFAQVRKHKNRAESVSRVVNSPLIQNLKRRQAKLEGALSKLSMRYGDKHPEIINARSELEELRVSIRSEQNKILSTIESEVQFSAARVRALEEGLAEAQGKKRNDKDVMTQLNVLMREAQSAQLVFDTFLETYQGSDVVGDNNKVQVLSYAVPAIKPSHPNQFLWLGVGAVLSLLAAVGVAALFEKLDNSFRSASQIEKILGYPCYALIPQMPIDSQKELADYIISKPSSVLAESIRTLRTVLNLRAGKGGKKPKVVTITSSLPGEGKTMLAVWLGRLAAKSNEKVIVVDADFRRSNVHRSVGKNNDATLVDYLTGQKELADIIQKTDISGVHMIYGRSVPNSALDLVSSDKMAKLVESLGRAYDLVVMDSPACLAVSDARVLASMSDHTVYVVEWGCTSRDVVASGVKQFTEMDYGNISFVLSNVNMKRHAKDGYGDSAHYYDQYKEYYNN